MPGRFGVSEVPSYGGGSAAPGSAGMTGGGGSPFPVLPSSQGVGGGSVVRFLPDWAPIPSAQEFNTLGQKATAVGENNIELPGAGFSLSAGQVARLSSVTLYVVNLVATSVLSFSVTINGNAVQGYGNVAVFPGAAARLTVSYQCFIRVPSAGKVQVFYTNTDGGTYIVGAALGGWIWSQADGDRWIAGS